MDNYTYITINLTTPNLFNPDSVFIFLNESGAISFNDLVGGRWDWISNIEIKGRYMYSRWGIQTALYWDYRNNYTPITNRS